MLVTKYVITSSESDILPSDIAMKIYGSGRKVNVKETCFGVMINGEEDVIAELVKDIRTLDPHGIFIKDRGFPPGDPRRCRGRRGGGARPGFYMIESETKLLPMISRALAFLLAMICSIREVLLLAAWASSCCRCCCDSCSAWL